MSPNDRYYRERERAFLENPTPETELEFRKAQMRAGWVPVDQISPEIRRAVAELCKDPSCFGMSDEFLELEEVDFDRLLGFPFSMWQVLFYQREVPIRFSPAGEPYVWLERMERAQRELREAVARRNRLEREESIEGLKRFAFVFSASMAFFLLVEFFRWVNASS